MPWGILSALPGWMLAQLPPGEMTEYEQRRQMRMVFERARARAVRRKRLIEQRGVRMSTRMERRREQIRARWWHRMRVVLLFAAVFPLVVAGIALAWRAAVWAITS